MEEANTAAPQQLPHFCADLHVAYIAKIAADLSVATSYEGAVTEHLRMSGIYWSLAALHILRPAVQVDALLGVTTTTTTAVAVDNNDSSNDSSNDYDNNAEPSIVDWLWTCFDGTSGSFGGNTGHQGHLLYTLSALQILALACQLQSERLLENKAAIVAFVRNLQQADGSFAGDLVSGEIDTRFTYCALQCLALLGELTATGTTLKESAVDYILQCRNLDGGFGSCIGAESHAGQVFCCVGALAIAGCIDRLNNNPDNNNNNNINDDDDLLAWWLSERQVDSGGLNGRPEKQADVCYSWWILSSLSILGKVSWISADKLAHYILKCQDDVDGGIADRPEDMADVFHTFFGIAGLSLLGHLHRPLGGGGGGADDDPHVSSFRHIDPVYALPTDICQKLQLPGQVNGSHQDGVDERLRHYKIHYTD